MPFCPKCRSEYRDGFTTCKSCGDVALVAELPEVDEIRIEELEATRPVGFATTSEISRQVELDDGKTIDLLRVFLLHEASELEGTLREANVPAKIVPVDAPFPDGQQRFEVRVRDDDFLGAEELLRSKFAERVEAEGTAPVMEEADAETCPACGAHVPLDVEECPECGLNVGGA